ncbi:MAG TPA: hypothetical protein VFP55_15030 [Solirubrobacteraceae bacterium]|nr:hypothetical protein [Solirubrobacteraceae bacterium]
MRKFAARQENLVTIEQLDGLGFTRREVEGLIRSRLLFRIHRGVYAVGSARLTRRGWLFAAQLACGESALLTHRTGAGVHGLRSINPFEIHVTIVGRAIRRRRGIVVHRITAPHHPAEITSRDGLRVARVPLILLQLASNETRQEVDRLIEQAARRGLLNTREMEHTLDRHNGAPGTRALRAAFQAYTPAPFDKSGFEREVAEAIAADPEIPPPLRNHLRFAGGVVWELDFYWEDARVALEVDGDRYHRTPRDRERDRIKDAKLMADGIVPMRITETRWMLDRGGALADLRAVLKARRGAAA